MRKLVTIQKIIDLQPIPDADQIEVATVLGWHCVVKKGEFKVGDLCCYHEVDCLLPQTREYEFLAKNGTKKTNTEGKEYEGYRLRTVKLRGQISQGLALPLSILEGKRHEADKRENPVYNFDEGADVTSLLGVVKYEPLMPVELSGQAKGFLAGYIPKTDEERIQSSPAVLTRYPDVTFYVAEKLDGSSVTMWIDKQGEFNVASRTMNWVKNESNSFWKAAIALGVEEKLKATPTIALQGELVGEGLQGNRLKLTGQTVYFYNAYDFENARYLNFDEFVNLIKSIGLETVPIIDTNFKLLPTVDEMVKYATRKSLKTPEQWAEGIVVRPLVERQDEDLKRLSFKTINPEYLLKHGE